MNCLIYLIKYIVLRIFSSWFCQCICDSVWLRCDYWTHQHFSLPKLNNGNQHFDNEHTVGRFVRNVARQRCGKRKWKSEQNVSKCLQSFGINAGSTINLRIFIWFQCGETRSWALVMEILEKTSLYCRCDGFLRFLQRVFPARESKCGHRGDDRKPYSSLWEWYYWLGKWLTILYVCS